MTDIVERLRRWREERSVAGGSWWETPEVCEQAADEIERLRRDASSYRKDANCLAFRVAAAEAEIERLRAALREMTEVAERAIRISQDHSDFKLYAMEPMWQAIDIARAALIDKEAGDD